MAKFAELPDVLQSSTSTASVETAAGFQFTRQTNEPNLVEAVCRVFGKPGVPVLADLETRTVYPLKG